MTGTKVIFGIEESCNWLAIQPEWDKADGARQPSVFQSSRWLAAWYDAFEGRAAIEPLLLTVRDIKSGLVAFHLPLLKRTVNGIRIAEFADLGLTLYNGPLLGPAVPREPTAVAAMWGQLRSALRGRAVDLVHLDKMPTKLGETPNPLALVEPARTSLLSKNLVTTDDDLDAYRFSTRRMQLARSWRVFTRHPDAKFRIITDEQEALRLMETLDEQQAERDLRRARRPSNVKARSAFHRNLVTGGIQDGHMVMSALTCGQEVVALALGVRQGTYFAVLRISIAGEHWSNCSPGRLILDRTIAALHNEGVREFDLGPGDDEFKGQFGATRVPLADVTLALSLRGALLFGLVKWVDGHPRLKNVLRGVLHQTRAA